MTITSRVAVCLVAFGAIAAWPARAQSPIPPIKHVFVIVLENESYATTFGPKSPAPYLARTLPSEGALVKNYYGIGHVSLDNYVAMISGQAPNPSSQSDCQQYTEFLPGTIGPDGQAVGQGCVFPAAVPSLPTQLEAKGLTWKGYMEDMGRDPSREPATCGHPPLNSSDNTQTASAKDQYATRHDPFVYFHAIIDAPSCKTNVVPLDALAADLAARDRTANLTFITPDLCSDGHDAQCADGSPGGLAAINGFLKAWVPKILASQAYRDDGLLVVTFDEADNSDATACCGEQPGPNSPMPGISGPGGGRVGAVLLSAYIRPGTTTSTAYNHYSLLRSIEDVFGVDHLGYAAATDLKPFGSDIYTRPAGSGSGGPAPTPAGRCSNRRLPRVAHRKFPRGTLIARAALRRAGKRLIVTLKLKHLARVRIGRGSDSHAHVFVNRRLRACRTYRIAVHTSARRLTVAASLPRGTERRRLQR